MEGKPIAFDDHLQAFKVAVLILLRSYVALKRILQLDIFNEITWTYYIDLLVAAKGIEYDLIVRISKFDRTKGAHSLQRAMLVLPLTHPNADLIKQRISSFSEGFEDIKQERRYEILAHLQEGLMDALNLTYDVGPAIRIIA